jgi:hypothetical protein
VDGINRLILLGLTGGKPMEIYGKIYAEHLIEGADRDAMAGIDLEASAEKDVSMVEGQSGKSTQVSKLILSWFSTRPE